MPINASQYGGGLENAEGKAYIFYSNANCGTGKISKPIIFLDGFDPSNDRGVQQIYDEYLNKTININGVDVKLGDKLRADGYDIIIFDYKDGGDFIEKNAMAVISLLQQLQFNFGTNTKEDYVLIGPSMGALVAQYALAYAEANQIATHTRLFISFDGPHQGANAPIGIQNLIDYIFQKGISSAVFKKLKNGIHRVPSAKQMLVHHSSANSKIPAADNFRSIFLNNLQAVNNYPTQLRKVAIINGSNNLSPNEYFQSTDEILYLRVKRSGLLGLVNGKLGDRLNVNIKASPSNGTVATTDVWLFSPLLNLFLWRGPSFVKSTQPTQNNFSYDKAVGSYFTDPVNERTDAWINIGQTLLYLSAGNKSTFRHNINPTFMPTTSAMDLQSNNFSLAYNFSDENIVCTGKTPFDRVYAPTSNQPHVQITSENAVWFDNEIKGDTSSIQPGGIGNIIIEGSSQICNSAETFTVPNLTAGATVNWTVYASSGVVSYSISGNSITLTKTGNGQVNLSATIITACGNFNLPSKNINVGALILGMPSFTNSDNQSPYWCSNNSSGNSFTIETNDLSASYEVKILTYPSLNLYASYDNIYPGNDIYSNVPPGYYIFQIRAIGACGTSDWVETEVESLDCSMNNYRTGNFNIYPNPANNELNLEFQYYGNTREIKVLNDKGDVLISSQTKKGEKTSKLNTKDLKNGTYYLHLTDEKKTIKKQIIIAH